MTDNNKDLLLVEEERDSDVKMGRITDTTYQKIENLKDSQQPIQKNYIHIKRYFQSGIQ